MCRLVTGKRGGERAVDHHRTDAGDKVAGAKPSVGLQGIDINAHRRGAEIDSNGVIAAAGIANGIADLSVNHVCAAISQCADIGTANSVAPASARLYGGGVSLAVQRQSHGLACGRRGRAADCQRYGMFRSVNNIIASEGINGHRRHVAIEGDVMSGAARIPRQIGNRSADGVAAVAQAGKLLSGDKH